MKKDDTSKQCVVLGLHILPIFFFFASPLIFV